VVCDPPHGSLRFPPSQIVPYPIISNGTEIKRFDFDERMNFKMILIANLSILPLVVNTWVESRG
jgi:hypothetical protein